MLDILGTKKEVLNLLLGNTPMILFHITFLFFNVIFYIIHLFLDFIYFFTIMFLSFIVLTLFYFYDFCIYFYCLSLYFNYFSNKISLKNNNERIMLK